MAKYKKVSFNSSDSSNILLSIGYLGLLVLLFYPPFFRGLFFQGEQQWTLIFASLLFVITWFGKLSNREVGFLRKPVDYLALALVLAFTVSFFFAVNPRLAMAEIIKYALYFLIFWLCSQLVHNNKDVKWLLHSIYLAGIGVALAGVMTASGIIHIKDGFLYGRIFSTMQYPNALASYLAALSFIGIYLWLKGMDNWTGEKAVHGPQSTAYIPGFLYAIGNYILLLIYIGTGSRGGLIVYPLVLLIYFIGLGKEYRYLAFGHFVLTVIAAMVANIKLMPMLVAENAGAAWLWFFIGVGVALAGQALLIVLSRIKISRQVLGIAAGVVLLAIVVFGWTQVKSGDTEMTSKLMPSHLITSFRNITLTDRNVQERFVFWQDAFKIVKEHPVFGLGGGAFEETNRRYQSYFYSSTQAHNHYMQMWTEVGTVGLIIFLAIWFFYKLLVLKLWWRQKDREIKLVVWSMYGTAAMLGLHAFLDFDLSLSSITIVLFAMLGLTRGVERYTFNDYKYLPYEKLVTWKWAYQAGVLGISAVIIIYMSMLNISFSHAAAGSKAYAAKDFGQAKVEFEKAVSLDKLNVDYRSDLSKVYLNLNEPEQAVKTTEEAVELAPYNVETLSNAVNIYAQVNNIDQVLAYSERLVENFPFNIQLWEGLTYRYFVAGYMAWTKGDSAEAKEMLIKATETPDRIEKQMAGVTELYKSMWGTQVLPVMSITPTVQLYRGAAQYIIHDWENAEVNLKAAFDNQQDEQLKGEAAMWLAVLYLKQENNNKAADITVQGKEFLDKIEDNVIGIAKLEVIN
ncbi:MAG: O-antigen ligase family protein [Dehalobacterium sp.]